MSKKNDELLNIEKKLMDNDFSKYSNKENVFNETLKSLDKYKGEDNMKKSKYLTNTVASLALVCLLSVSITQTSFGQNLADKVLKTISLGHITFVKVEEDKREVIPVPEKLKGKIFDKKGNPIEEVSKEYEGKFYTANGEEIYESKEDGVIITLAEYEKDRKQSTLTVKDSNDVNKYTCFNVILPSYLPKGYKFDRAEFYKDEEGRVKDSKYIDIIFKNGNKEIYMQQRFADEETAYATGANDTTEEIKINGIDAVIDDRNIDWEANNTLYSIMGKGNITKNELIRMAESIK